ncbi:ABC transporter permease subunit [Sinorhizobium medicae]|nr:ABC transporter permease subunit [Sinorhizobium medicae]
MQTLHKLGRMPIALTAPALIMFLTVVGIPTCFLFLSSLNSPHFSVINYQAFFSQYANIRVLYQTVEISVVVSAICLLVGYPTAYLIATASKHLRVALIVLVIIPYLTSMLVRTYAWLVILGDSGLINRFLLNIGLISSPASLVYNRMAVYIGMVQIMLPMMILPLVSVMMGIDRSLVSAAQSMGAPPLRAFWRVFFPLSLSGVRSGSLLVFVICLGFYITPAALGGLGDAMLSTFIASQVRTSFNIASVATSAFVLLAVAFIVLSMLGLNLSGTPGRTVQSRQKVLGKFYPSIARLSGILNEVSTPNRAKHWASQLYRPGRSSAWLKVASFAFITLVMFFLLFPEILILVMSFGGSKFLEFPPSTLSLQWYRNFFSDPTWYGAALNSIEIGIIVAALSTILGTLAAYGLSRTNPQVRSFLTLLLLTPITIPVIVIGVSAYLGLVKLGLIGSKTGIILAHSVGAVGYVVVIVSATLANFDPRLEQAAKSMRASPYRTFMRVTLPLIRPGLIAGGVFAFLHSFDEVVITSLVSGFSVRTLPLKMWEDIRHQIDPTIAAVGSLLILLPILCLIVLYAVWQRSGARSQHLLLKPTI